MIFIPFTKMNNHQIPILKSLLVCISLSKLMILCTCYMIALLINTLFTPSILIKQPLHWHQRKQKATLWLVQGNDSVFPKDNYGGNFLAVSLMKLLMFSRAGFQGDCSGELAAWLKQSPYERPGWNYGRSWSLVSGYSETYGKCNFILPLKFMSRRSFTLWR